MKNFCAIFGKKNYADRFDPQLLGQFRKSFLNYFLISRKTQKILNPFKTSRHMVSFSTRLRKLLLLFIDLILSTLSIFASHLLRWGGNIPEYYIDLHLKFLFPFLIIRTVVFISFNFYSRFWEFSTIEDLIQIIKSVILGSILAISVLFLYDRNLELSRSVMFIDILLLIIMLGGSRLFWRLWRERKRRLEHNINPKSIHALILGAGNTGAQLLTYLRRFSPNYSIKGFIDNDPKKINQYLLGIRVLGHQHDIPTLSKTYGIKEVLVAVPTISSKNLNEVVNICNQIGIRYKIISSVLDLSTQEVHISKLKNIEINDLLDRKQVSLDVNSIKEMIKGRKVLVTGAGGSIGSELCSHILEHSPEALIMLDRGENYLYELKVSLSCVMTEAQTYYYFGSITNTKKMESIFSKHRPDLVFHAAAHKHVPLMEENIDEAIINNIQGTQVIAKMAKKFEVEKFVFVSTDKVVNPKSVMGMTKKVAEIVIQLMAQKNKTQFMIVRFGNVLGSNGSIVPLLHKQIKTGGPVTITHPKMERYFMLISEAVQLILQAGALGSGREIFVLEMGKPVKIIDLANKMIKLAGYNSDNEIKIELIGVRPGEKLSEELIDHGENIFPTRHEKIKLLKTHVIPSNDFMEKVDDLCQKATQIEPLKLRHALFELTMTKFLAGQEKPQNSDLNKENKSNQI